MTKEDKVRAQMIALGTWTEAFGPVVHSLCILERETSRIRAAWKATAPPGRSPSAMDPHYAVIAAMAEANAYIPFEDSAPETGLAVEDADPEEQE